MEGFLPDKRWLLAPWTCDNTKVNINKPHEKFIWVYPFGVRSANSWSARRKAEVSWSNSLLRMLVLLFTALLHTPFKSLYQHHFIEGFSPGTLLWIGACLCILVNKVSRQKASRIIPDMDHHQPLSNQREGGMVGSFLIYFNIDD